MSMELTFATATETTVFKDRAAVLIEADYEDEQGGEVRANWAQLTRLDNRRHSGDMLSSQDHQTVLTLAKKVGRLAEKKVFVSADTLRRRGMRAVKQQGILTDPLGPYYTKLSLDFSIYGADEINQAWDTNPIEAVEISMIPGNVTPERLRSHRLSRCMAVTLHFQNPGFSEVMTLLMGLGIKLDCRVLELRNITANEAMLTVLKMRLQWPQLQNIIIGKRV